MNKTIGQCLWERVQLDGEHTAMETGEWSCTFRQMDTVSDYLAGNMERYGIQKGTHVGIWSVNSPNWVFTFLALVKLGAVPVLINTCYRQEEVKGILNYADVEVLYYGAGYKTILYEDIVTRLRNETPKIRHFIHINEKEAGKWMGEDSFLPEDKLPQTTRKIQEKKKLVSPEDPACMIFTSGTTSLPKGVLLSHYNVVNNASCMVSSMRWGRDDKMCITVPLFHCFGITAGIISCLLGGMSMYLIPYFKTGQVWDAIDRYHCTVLNGVPSMFLAMNRKEAFLDRDAGGLKSGIIAGSSMTEREYQEISGRFYNMHLQPSYGQTETSPCVSIADWDETKEEKAVSAGKIAEFVQVRFSNWETGEILKNGEQGEIQVKGYNVMQGYYNLPKANEKAFTKDGWLRTGDIGRLDETGHLHITGRLKEMIIRAGENISPQEIEQVILQLDWVSSVKVVGVPAEVLQEEIAACIIPKAGCVLNKQELLDYIKPRLAHYKVPAFVLPFHEFPMNASGKIKLKALKEMAKEMAVQERKGI